MDRQETEGQRGTKEREWSMIGKGQCTGKDKRYNQQEKKRGIEKDY